MAFRKVILLCSNVAAIEKGNLFLAFCVGARAEQKNRGADMKAARLICLCLDAIVSRGSFLVFALLPHLMSTGIIYLPTLFPQKSSLATSDYSNVIHTGRVHAADAC